MKPLLNATEIAKMLNIPRSRVLYCFRTGELEGYKIGRTWVATQGSIKDFLEENLYFTQRHIETLADYTKIVRYLEENRPKKKSGDNEPNQDQ